MRIGQNPAKSTTEVSHPQPVTVAVLTFIPFLQGYYKQSLEVLKICLGSILEHTDKPFDLMVFDNASCSKVVDHLNDLKQKGYIQYLIQSDRNVGKVGAWNFIFGAAPGEYIVYSDSDVYFFPNWLSKHMEVFRAFPEAGTVGGLPRRGRRDFYTNTMEIARTRADIQFEEGKFIPDEWIIEHAHSLGKMDTVAEDLKKTDYRLTRNGVSAYATATHFQFMVKKKVISQFIPFPYDRPMGSSVAHFDQAINGSKLLRLAVNERVVKHLGNTLDDKLSDRLPATVLKSQGDTIRKIKKTNKWFPILFEQKMVRWILLKVYDWIFQVYYGSRIK